MGHPGCCHLHSHPARSAVPLPRSLAPGNPVPTLRRWNQNIPCGEASPPAKREKRGISVKFEPGRNGRGRKSRASGRDKQTQGHRGSEGSARAGPGNCGAGSAAPCRHGVRGRRGEAEEEDGERYGRRAGKREVERERGSHFLPALKSAPRTPLPAPSPGAAEEKLSGRRWAAGAGQGPRAVSARAERAALPLLHPALRSRGGGAGAGQGLWEGEASPSTRCPGRAAPGAAAGVAPGAGGAGQRERGRGVPRGAAPRQARAFFRAFPGRSRRNGAAVGAAAGRAPQSEGGRWVGACGGRGAFCAELHLWAAAVGNAPLLRSAATAEPASLCRPVQPAQRACAKGKRQHPRLAPRRAERQQQRGLLRETSCQFFLTFFICFYFFFLKLRKF